MRDIKTPSVADSRVLTYLNARNKPLYENTEEENELLALWREKYYLALSEYKASRAAPDKVAIWRKAYEGDFNALDSEGKSTDKKMKAIRKLGFELVEGKINSKIPAPKMSPRHHCDLVPVNATEKLIKHEMDKMLAEDENDTSEHNVLIDGTSWFKVSWNPFDNTHERSGNPIVEACKVDTVIPQPGVKNYRKMEYIFELGELTVAECIDMYDREIQSPLENDIIPVITCYYLNEDRYLGKFMWCEETSQVICNDLEWGIRKERRCSKCDCPVTIDNICPVCGSKKFRYKPVKEFTLEEPLVALKNPYRNGETQDQEQDETVEDSENTIPVGTVIPHYLVRQLPFVPYRRLYSPYSKIYGMSEIELVLEDQDIINKMLNKAENKSARSKTYLTKLKDTRISPKSDEITMVEVESPQEGQAIQVKQVMSDITEEITQANVLYEIAKSTVGVTDTDQGKNDPSARSGKAKQLQMAASAQRNQSPQALRNLAFAGVYELIFKFMLAYCDDVRTFVSLLPDGSQTEETWSKFMFLSKDKYGNFYYRDDYAWSVDTATDVTEDRAAMWQLIDNDYINGTMGNQIDPNRALLMYWQMKDQFGYPTAKYAIDFLKSAQKHLPSDVEQTLAQNPEAVELALSYLKDRQAGMMTSPNGGGQGGARPGAGREGNGATHAANVEKTNNANRAASGQTSNTGAVATGGMQGGTSLLGGE